MPRSRVSEMHQRPSPRGSHQLRTSSSDSDSLQHRPITDRSPKLGDRRSPRGPASDSVNQKKLGTRIADLESQLGQAQDELRTLKEQLASAEAAKKQAQEELESKKKKPTAPEHVQIHDKHSAVETFNSENIDKSDADVPEENQRDTDVFEVPLEKTPTESVTEPGHIDQTEKETKAMETMPDWPAVPESDKPSSQDLAPKSEEISMLKSKLEEKEKELEGFVQENGNLKGQLKDAASNLSTAKDKEGELNVQLSQVEQELKANKQNADQLKQKLGSVQGEKEALEAEMKKLRIQTEQWRKAADAAATILAGGVEMNGRISDRCSSMDKHFGGVFEPPAGNYASLVGSPGYLDDGFGSGKRKGSGIKMFGDLWRRKGQK